MPRTRKPVPTLDDRRRARRERRDRALKARGLRPVTIWVRDPDSPAFRAEARRQMQRVGGSRSEREFAEVWAPNQDTTGWSWDE